MSNNEVYNIIEKFRSLTADEQKEFLKRIVLNEYTNGFIDYKVDNFVPPVSVKQVHEGAKKAYRERLEEQTNKAIDKTIDVLRSSDEELKYKLFGEYVDGFAARYDNIKKSICGETHDFPEEWNEKIGERPRFNELGSIEGYYVGNWFERTCRYCGTIQKAWNEKEKQELTEKYKKQKSKTYGMKNSL